MSLAEKNRERANIVTQKKWRPLNLGLIGRQKRVFRARAGREKRHESGHIFG
jgi:predicted Zn-dependent protease